MSESTNNSLNSFKIPKKLKPKYDFNELLEDENHFEEFADEEWTVDTREADHWDDNWDQTNDIVKDTPEDQELKALCLKTLEELKDN